MLHSGSGTILLCCCCCGFFVFFVGYPENAKYPPDKNCVSCSRHKIVWKLVHLGVKMTSLVQKHKSVMKHVNFGVSKLHISFRKIAYLGLRKLRKTSESQVGKCCILICVKQKTAYVKNHVISLY